LEQAVAQASSPAVRMRLLLAFAAAPALADQHAVRWRALLAP
jgi:hypothetical protein